LQDLHLDFSIKLDMEWNTMSWPTSLTSLSLQNSEESEASGPFSHFLDLVQFRYPSYGKPLPPTRPLPTDDIIQKRLETFARLNLKYFELNVEEITIQYVHRLLALMDSNQLTTLRLTPMLNLFIDETNQSSFNTHSSNIFDSIERIQSIKTLVFTVPLSWKNITMNDDNINPAIIDDYKEGTSNHLLNRCFRCLVAMVNLDYFEFHSEWSEECGRLFIEKVNSARKSRGLVRIRFVNIWERNPKDEKPKIESLSTRKSENSDVESD